MRKTSVLIPVVILLTLILSIGIADTILITSSSRVNVRNLPGTDGDIVGKAQPGQFYEYIETSPNGWFKIKLEDGTTGYVSGKMGKLSDESVSLKSSGNKYTTSSKTDSDKVLVVLYKTNKELYVSKDVYTLMEEYCRVMDDAMFHMFYLQDMGSKEWKKVNSKLQDLDKKIDAIKNTLKGNDKKYYDDTIEYINDKIALNAAGL